MSTVRWLADHRDDEQVLFRIGRDGDQLVAEWVGVLRLVARRDGTVVEMTEAADANPLDINKIRRGSAQLLLRQLRGELALHGAAVGLAGGVVVFLGRSGHGKSTLAAALCARRGAVLFGDDALMLEATADGYFVTASEVDHWLLPSARAALGLDDAVPAKVPVRSASPAIERGKIAMLVDLTFDDAAAVPRLRTLSGLEAVACLIPQVVRFVIDEPSEHRRELESLAMLVHQVPVFQLERPRRLELLDASMALLTSHPLLEQRT